MDFLPNEVLEKIYYKNTLSLILTFSEQKLNRDSIYRIPTKYNYYGDWKG